MKKQFSIKWKASKQPRKQRKYLANAGISLRRKILSANLSKELRKKHNRRNFQIRKGDQVKVLRGGFKGKTGKVDLIDLKNLKVTIEGIQFTKKDGTKINVKFSPSKLQIQNLNLDDNKRNESIKKPEAKK